MAHNNTVVNLLERSLKLKRNEEREKLLEEFYSLIDEYNQFVIIMDKKFDKVVSKMEAMIEDEH